MSQDRPLPLTLWLAGFRALMAWHRYTIDGLEHLERPGSALVVGYHGRSIAIDMCMFTVAAYDRLGYLPHGVMHKGFDEFRPLKWVKDGIGFVGGDDADLAVALARGEHIVTLPGGTREGCRSFRHRYRVDWGQRMGYLCLALRHRLPIIPVGGAGMDDTYLGLNDGYRLGKRVGMPAALPLWLGIGPTGVWPFSPPFPVRIRHRVGAPIELPADLDPADRDALAPWHARVVGAVQALIDDARRA